MAQFLAENWAAYRPHIEMTARVECDYGNCARLNKWANCRSFFDLLVKKASWVPVKWSAGKSSQVRLMRPSRCWIVSSALDRIVRMVLPTPSDALAQLKYANFCHDIGMRRVAEAGLDDYMDMLRALPEQYSDPAHSGRKEVPRTLETFTRWVLESVNNVLIEQNASNVAALQSPVTLVAKQGKLLRYVEPSTPVFFPDDPYIAAPWRDHLLFAPMDPDWKNAARYLGLRFISESVAEDYTIGAILEDETDKLKKRFSRARKYILALVNLQARRKRDRVLRDIRNLELCVVASLRVDRYITGLTDTVLNDDMANFYLEEPAQQHIGSAGPVHGRATLYVRQGCEAGDFIGRPIAEFIEQPGLSDALVILFDRDPKGRLIYVKSRGVRDEDIAEIEKLLASAGVRSVEEPEVVMPVDFDRGITQPTLQTLLGEQGQHPKPAAPPVAGAISGSGEGVSPVVRHQEDLELPDLDPSKVIITRVEEPAVLLDDENAALKTKRRGHVLGQHDWDKEDELNRKYGERGERIVWLKEIERLREEGHESPETAVRWLRAEGNDDADHDLESLIKTSDGWHKLIIEVKATSGTGLRPIMSLPELECARDYGEWYRLYRVIRVGEAAPEIYIYDNPVLLWQEKKARILLQKATIELPNQSRLHR